MSTRFDAATDRVSCSSTPPDPAAGITIAGWAYVVAANGEGNQTFARVHAAGGASTAITFATDGNPPAGPGYFTAGGSITSGTQCPAGEWRKVAVTCLGTAGTLYAATPGGVTEVDSGTVGGAASPTGITLGGRSAGDSSEWFNGRLAYWRVWAARLTLAEVEAEWLSTTPVRTTGLWADWPLEAHTDLTDHSGNGRHLTAGSTSTTTEAGPPLTVGGPINPAVETATALPLGAAKSRGLGTAGAVEQAMPFGRRKRLALGTAYDISTAQPLARSKARGLTAAMETDSAVRFGAAKTRAIGTAGETDTALPLGEPMAAGGWPPAVGLPEHVSTVSVGSLEHVDLVHVDVS